MNEEIYRQISQEVSSKIWGVMPIYVSLIILVYILYCYIQATSSLDVNKFKGLTYPFMVAIFLSLGTYIFPVIDMVLSPTVILTEAAAVEVVKERNELVKEKLDLLDKKKAQLAEIKNNEYKDDNSLYENTKVFFNKVIDKIETIKNLFSNLPIAIQQSGTLLMTFIIEFSYIIASKVILFYSYFYRIIIVSLFPITLTLSIIPAYRQNAVDVIKKYINMYLYIPIVNLLMLVMGKVSLVFLRQDIAELKATLPEDIETYDNYVYISFLLLCVVAFFFVPTISKWFLNTIMGNIGSNLKNALKSGYQLLTERDNVVTLKDDKKAYFKIQKEISKKGIRYLDLTKNELKKLARTESASAYIERIKKQHNNILITTALIEKILIKNNKQLAGLRSELLKLRSETTIETSDQEKITKRDKLIKEIQQLEIKATALTKLYTINNDFRKSHTIFKKNALHNLNVNQDIGDRIIQLSKESIYLKLKLAEYHKKLITEQLEEIESNSSLLMNNLTYNEKILNDISKAAKKTRKIKIK